jgi:hypothetical protein
MLPVEPAFQHELREWCGSCAPHVAELHLIDVSNVWLSLSADGELTRTVELPLSRDPAWLAWNDIVAAF